MIFFHDVKKSKAVKLFIFAKFSHPRVHHRQPPPLEFHKAGANSIGIGLVYAAKSESRNFILCNPSSSRA